MAARMFEQICYHFSSNPDMCTPTVYWWFGLGLFIEVEISLLGIKSSRAGLFEICLRSSIRRTFKVVFSLVWLAFMFIHICLLHFLKKFLPLHIQEIPFKRKSIEIELRTVFKLTLITDRQSF